MIALYRDFAAMVRDCGPITVVPEKTRIAFQVRMSFAAVTLRQRWLDGHVHQFRVQSAAELDAQVAGWLREAYAVGQQLHLSRRRPLKGNPSNDV